MKKFAALLVAGVLSVGVLSLAACKPEEPENSKIPQMPSGVKFTLVTDTDSQLFKIYNDKLSNAQALRVQTYSYSKIYGPNKGDNFNSFKEKEEVVSINVLKTNGNAYAFKSDNYSYKTTETSGNAVLYDGTGNTETCIKNENYEETQAGSVKSRESASEQFNEVITPKRLSDQSTDFKHNDLPLKDYDTYTIFQIIGGGEFRLNALNEEHNFNAVYSYEPAEYVSLFVDRYRKNTNNHDTTVLVEPSGYGHWIKSGKVYISSDSTKVYIDITEEVDYGFKNVKWHEKEEYRTVQYIDLSVELKESDFPDSLMN